MFLTRSGIKKLMSTAYKGGGLRVRNDGAGYSISGAYWAVYFLHGEIPKETLGDLIAMVGELPAKRESYTATKAGNQMEIWDDSDMSAMQISEVCNQDMERTRIRLVSMPWTICLLQNRQNGEITPVNDYLVDIIQPSLIDAEDDEELPIGPSKSSGTLCENKFFPAACWSNDRMAYCVGYLETGDGEIKRIIHSLEELQLWEGGNGQAE